MFAQPDINLELLHERAYNLRWAAVPKGVIPLTAADPDFPCAPEISESICQFASQRYFSYAPPEGYLFFRESVARWYQEKRAVSVGAQHVLAVDSAAFGIYTVCAALLAPGDEAIIFDPVDFLFKYAIDACGATPVALEVPVNPALSLDYDRLETLISPQTKMICLCNPLNPTGKVFRRDELHRLAAIAERHDLVILSDEIWSDIVFRPGAYVSIASLDEAVRQRTVIVTGYSKSYGLAGLRAGAVITANDHYFQLIFQRSRHQFTVHGSNVLAQVAVRTALDTCGYWLEAFVIHLQEMRDLCLRRFNEIVGFSTFEPQGCYLLFPNVSGTGMDEASLQAFLLKEAKVAVVPGLPRWFGACAAGHIRISFATSEEILTEALNRIENCLLQAKETPMFLL